MKMLESELFEAKSSTQINSFSYSSTVISIPQDGRDVSLHWHNDFEIIRVLDGQGFVSIDLERFSVKSGDICLVLPNQLHYIEQLERSFIKVESIRFSLDLLLSANGNDDSDHFFLPLMAGQQIIPWLITRDYPWYDSFSACLDEASQLCTFYPNGYALAVKSRLYQLFYIIFFNEPAVPAKSRPVKSVEKARQIVDYITEHYREHLTLEQMAAFCGFSESHFMKFFKSVIGITFTECINNYRLSQAAQLLANESMPVSKVADYCGFENISYFNRLFKKKYGTTPSTYRKRLSA